MKTFAKAAAFAVGATAIVLPRDDGCCFSLTASGGVSGTASQLSDGQIRFGSNAPDGTSQFCLNNGGLTDGSGRDCVISDPTTQIQCDAGAKSPAGGFSVGSDCNLAHNGDETFYACPSGSGYNLYLQPVDNQPKCVKITVNTSGKCCAAKSSSSMMSSTQMSSTCPAPSTVYKTSTVSASTVTVTNVQESTKYQTTTVEQTEYNTKTVEMTETDYKTQPASTVTVVSTAAPSTVTVVSTQVQEQTEYQTKTEEITEYNTKTVEQTETAVSSAPAVTVTAYQTTTAMASCPAPSTYWKTTTQQMTMTEQMSCPAPSTYWKTSMMTSMMTQTVSDCSSVATTQTVPVKSSPVMTSSMPAVTTAVGNCCALPMEKQPNCEAQCKSQYDACRTAANANQAYCASQYAGCLGYSPFPFGTATTPQATACPFSTHVTIDTTNIISTISNTMKTMTSAPASSTGIIITSTTDTNYKSTPPASKTATGSACQTELTGAYQTPHLIVPVCSEKPDEAFGTSYFGSVNSTFDSVFNFDIPASYAGKTCSVIFMFPEKSQLETSDYTFNGQGSMSCKHLSSAANMGTTWNNCPKSDADMGTVGMKPGNTYVISSGPCAAGTTQTYELSPEGGMDLYYFQDWNPSPIGMYITAC